MRSVVLFFVLIFGYFSMMSQNNRPYPYSKMWQKVDSLEKKGLIKSALEIVNQIHQQAKTDNIPNIVVKSYIYKIKYRNVIEEDAFETLLSEISKEANNASFPYSSLYHTLSAELYWQYYLANRYRFYTRTYSPDEGDDIRSWSLEHLADVIIKHHLKALEPADELKKASIEEYKYIMLDYNTEFATKFRPTLYDFIAFRAIDFFSSKEITLSKPADTFELNDSLYFSDIATFIKLKPTTTDSFSLQYYGIKILQDLLAFHQTYAQPEALIDANLKRLEFVYRNSTLANKEFYYLRALKNLHEQYKLHPFSNAIVLQLSTLMLSLSEKYQFDDSTTYNYRYYKSKAIELAQQAIQNFPTAFHTPHLKAFIQDCLTPSVYFEIEDAAIPNEPFAVKYTYTNIEKVYTQIRSIDQKVFDDLSLNYYDHELLKQLYNNSILVQEKTITFPKTTDYLTHSIEAIYNGIPKGFYIIFCSTSNDFLDKKAIRCFQKLYVTNIAVTSTRNEDGSYTIILTKRNEGSPIINATITEYWLEYGQRKHNFIKGQTYQTNQLGMANILEPNHPYRKKSYGNVYLEIKTTEETLLSDQYYYLSPYYSKSNSQYYSVILFTDRAIYRPGQTVYYKGIVLEVKNEDKNIAPQIPLNVTLRDANYQIVEEQLKTSNEFGTFHGSFIIPEGLLNGTFSIQTPHGSCSFRVEEYKRPKFFVEAEATGTEYFLNDSVSVQVSVKSYAGVALQQIPVKYRVTRIPQWRGYYHYFYRNMPIVEIAQGMVSTDEQGKAVIRFKAIPDNKYPINESTFYQYKVEMDATDINQETQSAQCIISVGAVGLFFRTSLSDIITSNELKSITITAENANGKKIASKGTINLYRLEDNKTPLRNRLWTRPDTTLYSETEWNKIYPGNVFNEFKSIETLKPLQKLYTSSFEIPKDTAINLPIAQTLLPGNYMLEIISNDSKGKEVKYKQFFILYSFEQNSTLPSNDALFVVTEKTTYIPGEKAKIIIGSAFHDAFILMNTSYFNNPINYQWMRAQQQKVNVIEIPITESHRGNLILNFLLIKNNRHYQKDIIIQVPYDNKELSIKTENFRSKITPGQKETWKLRITGIKGEKVTAELLATMYDKSLDAFIQHNWSFSPFPWYYNNLYFTHEMFHFKNSNCYTNREPSTIKITNIIYPKLNLFGFHYYGGYRYRNGMGKKTANARNESTNGIVMAAEASPPTPGVVEEKTTALADKNLENKDSETKSEKPAIRTNLKETAFFFPNLTTNERGEVEFSFNSPEALTTWKFMAFAHTKDLKYGILQQECITQKELMITPQLPRFFREGDNMVLFVKVDNISNSDQKPIVTLIIEDAINGSANNKFSKSTTISIKPNQSQVVSFEYKVPQNLSLVKVTCIAETKLFSDGEEVMLPVLPNRMLVTESLPFYIRGNQSKQINFNRMNEIIKSTTLTHQSLKLEYTANPIWYAVMAIPYLRSYPYECNEQLFNRYYSNVLSKYIVSSIPNFKQIFGKWQTDTLHNTLISPLSKNEELKQATITETPWVEESLTETEQRRNVAKYFDEKRIEKELNEAASKLIKNQYPNGAWGWFAGMPENRYITQYIVSRNGRLEKAYDIDTKLSSAMDKAIAYLDQQILKDYQDILRNNEDKQKYVPSSFQVHYLYARSFYLNKHKNFLKSEAYLFFYNQAKKNWTEYNEYIQGMLSLVLHRNNETEKAKEIVKSLKERCVVNEEQGMYWKTISRGLLWTEAPIEAQSLLMEAFNEIMYEVSTINELKLWLLLQKQTQNWKTTIATADAIYALLFFGNRELNTNFDAEITWGDKPLQISTQNIEYATGYIKNTISANEIQPKHSKIEIKNKGKDLSWGAIHWQYFENLDKISQYDSKYMSIKREYYLETMTSSGKRLVPISENALLKTGDVVVVRLVVECDRNLEFVHIKDMRPSSFEPMQVLSGYFYKDGLGYYGEVKDASYNIFIDRMNRGKYVMEYSLRVSQKGTFSTGIATIQCMYAPEFNAHARGMTIVVR
ncbi:MAG: MG2 domain-containing protein [Bacteroidales bacterium]|nr:MG2 domain-containing protein [Bacteroidales bacterium]